MIRRIIIAILLYVEDLISRWAERREIERTRDAQRENDERDRGSAGDVSKRWRHRAGRERDTGGGVTYADDRGSTDPRG
ncbi:MAG: hypothetical protein LAT55_13815 [Opitutales bacterium]|nr:hypothetical protein [Opitutales bacterium]